MSIPKNSYPSRILTYTSSLASVSISVKYASYTCPLLVLVSGIRFGHVNLRSERCLKLRKGGVIWRTDNNGQALLLYWE